MSLKAYKIIMATVIAFLLFFIFYYGDGLMFAATYLFVFFFMSFRAMRIRTRKLMVTGLISTYFFLFLIQAAFSYFFHAEAEFYYLHRFVGLVLALCPVLVEKNFTVKKYVEFYPPHLSELSALSLAEIKASQGKIISVVRKIKEIHEKVTHKNLSEAMEDVMRTSSFRYVANSNLSDEYFDVAYESLSDDYIYIIISNTGSPPSELLSVLTEKPYNHASISFDSDLKTVVSYSGGEKVYPPGLNMETIEFFNKKETASIIVYKLFAGYECKKMIIDRVKQINEEGSAYNVLGLVFRKSMKPNIMFCSQFVYKMLKHAGIEYFDKSDGNIRPTDLIELDYYRKLEFAYEIYLNDKREEKQSV